MAKQFYETEEFIFLQSEWYERLKAGGFVDLEARLDTYKYNPRTVNFDQREKLLNFFLKLDHWLNSKKSAVLTPKKRQILSLFSSGISSNAIAIKAKCSTRYVRMVVAHYKAHVLKL